MSTAYQVGQLVDKMSNADKDYRFMAINDLMREISQNELQLDEDSAGKVVRALVRLLEDQTGEVQNLTIRCLGTLAQPNKLRQAQMEWIVDAVSPQLMRKEEQQRDVFNLALKSIVINLAPVSTSNSYSAAIARRLVPKLNAHLSNPALDDVARTDIIDLLGEVLLRFGDTVAELHTQTHAVLLEQLNSSRLSVRKRTINAFGYLAAVASARLYDTIVAGLLEKLGTAKGPSTCRTYIVALTYVAKSSGTKFSDHLSKVVPYLIQFLRSSEDDELREAALQGLEAFLYRCPAEVAAFQTDVQQVLSANLAHDPNYEYGDEDEDEDMETEDDDDEYSDDEDISWKVRRAAAKAIEAMITSRRENLLMSVSTLGPLLISRFREREEAVRSEVIGAYVALLSQVHTATSNISSAIVNDDDMSDDIVQIGGVRFSAMYVAPEQLTILGHIEQQKEKLLRYVVRMLKKNNKNAPRCLDLITELVRLYPGILSGYLSELIPAVSRTLVEKSATSQGKMTALCFTSRTLSRHEPQAFDKLLPLINEMVISAIEDPFYKVAGEGLVLSVKLVDVMHALHCDSEYVQKLFQTINKKFVSNDTDQDVRERAIIAVAHIVSVFPKQLDSEVPSVLEKLFDRLSREMTGFVATKVFAEVASSEIDISQPIVAQLLVRMASFLKKSSRANKIVALTLIECLLKKQKKTGESLEELSNALTEVCALVNDSDLQITHQALQCLSYAFSHYTSCMEVHLPTVLNTLVTLVQSPLLQGATLTAMMDLVVSIVEANTPKKPKFEELLDLLTSPVYDVASLPRQAYVAISSATSVVAKATNDVEKGKSLAAKLEEQLSDQHSTDSIRLFAMSTLGELGRRFPQVFDDSRIKPENLAMEAFNSQSEDLKGAAAHALGALAVGNLPKYLPFILEQIRNQPKRRYLLLHALKEIILWESSEADSTELFRSAIEDIWQLLIANAGGQEDGARSVVAECLGRLCAFDPATLLPELKQYVSASDAVVRSVVVSSLKYMISDDKRNIDVTLQRTIGGFLNAVKDEDLNVRRVALVVLNSAAHNKPSLIRELLPTLLPTVYQETTLRKELIREIDMGPFKHQVDDGLDLRKCAFECMYTLLENCADKIDVNEFLQVMEAGLKDPNQDVKMLNYLTLQKIATLAPGQVLQRIDRICEPLKTQLTARSRSNAVKQEIEKLEELKKAAVRVIFALRKLPDVERQQQFVDLNHTVKANKELQEISDAVVKESQRTVVYDVPMEA